MVTIAEDVGWIWGLSRALVAEAAARPWWTRPGRAGVGALEGQVEVGRRAKVYAAGAAGDGGFSADLPVAAAMVRSVSPAGRLGLLTDRPLNVGRPVLVRFSPAAWSTVDAGPSPDATPLPVARCVVRRCGPGGTGRVLYVVEVAVLSLRAGV